MVREAKIFWRRHKTPLISWSESPSSEDIDLLIILSWWLLLNLSTNDEAVASSQYQSDIQNIIRTNCASLYVQADKAILRRF